MFSQRALASTLAALILAILPVSESQSLTDGGTQFIYYSGAISGSFAHNTTRYNATLLNAKNQSVSACGDNGVYYFAGISDDTSMRIGAHPPWDQNPFFFQIAHENEYLDVIEAVSYLSFATAYFVCFVGGGELCPEFTSWPWYYVATRQVNLTAASISTVKDVPIAEEDKGPFYSVKGDDKTWISNGTVPDWNRVQFQRPGNYSTSQLESPDDCMENLDVNWDTSNGTHFTYALNFTNTTAVASFVMTIPEGVLTISFAGQRQDNNDSATAPEDFYNQFTAISLANPANHSSPHFTFANGTEFEWKEKDTGEWYAKSASVRIAYPDWMILGTMTVSALLLLLSNSI